MTERKEEPDRQWPLTDLHQLSHHVVDRSDMVRVHGVPQSEGVSQERRSQESGLTAE
jgi:hypothetical protein